MQKPEVMPRDVIEALSKDPIYGPGAAKMIELGKWVLEDEPEAPVCRKQPMQK